MWMSAPDPRARRVDPAAMIVRGAPLLLLALAGVSAALVAPRPDPLRLEARGGHAAEPAGGGDAGLGEAEVRDGAAGHFFDVLVGSSVSYAGCLC